MSLELKELTLRPQVATLEPALYVNAVFNNLGNAIVPLEIWGYVFLDGLQLGALAPLEYGRGIQERLVASDIQVSRVFSRSFYVSMSRRAIDTMNQARAMTPKGDIKIHIKFSVSCLESIFHQSVLPGHASVTGASLTEGALLNYRVDTFARDCNISASEWLHDYYPFFGLDRYVVVELPVITEKINGGNDDELTQRIQSAYEAFEDMKVAFQKADWSLVVKESRPVWELQRKRPEIDLLLRSDDFSTEAIQSFNKLLEGLFDFASKFLHRGNRDKNVMAISKASKEDAVLVYSMAASVLNLITQKKKRSG